MYRMKKLYLKTMAAALCLSAGTVMHAQETTTYTPLKIATGLNADLIAESSASTGSGSSTQSTVAGSLDNDGYVLYTSGWNTTNPLTYNGDYLQQTDPTYGFQYYMEQPTGNNAVQLVDAGSPVTITVTDVNGNAVQYVDKLFLLATSGSGTSTIKVELLDADGNVIGDAQQVRIEDWCMENTGDTYNTIVSGDLGRRMAKGTNFGNSDTQSCNLRRLDINVTDKTKAIASIRLTRINVAPNSSSSDNRDKWPNGRACIFSVVAQSSQVVLKETETSLDYLSSSTTGGKTVVTLQRVFKADQWNPFCFPMNLTVAQLKELLGNDIQLCIANGNSYKDNTIKFQTVDLSNSSATAILKDMPYIVKGVSVNDDNAYTLHSFVYTKPTATSFTESVDNTGNNNQDALFHGTYVQTTTPTSSYYAMSGGLFKRYSDAKTLKGFRFYITLADGTTTNAPASISLDIDDQVTAIKAIDAPETSASRNVYSLSGQLLSTDGTSQLPSGLYIVGGKKIMVK